MREHDPYSKTLVEELRRPRQTEVITWQAPNGATIDVCPSCEETLTGTDDWPGNRSGEYCSVSYGLHDSRSGCELCTKEDADD